MLPKHKPGKPCVLVDAKQMQLFRMSPGALYDFAVIPSSVVFWILFNIFAMPRKFPALCN